MFRNGAKTAVLLAALGGVMVGIGSLFGRGGAIIAPAQASHFIVNPLTGRSVGFANLFRTHPSTQERVARLRGRHV